MHSVNLCSHLLSIVRQTSSIHDNKSLFPPQPLKEYSLNEEWTIQPINKRHMKETFVLSSRSEKAPSYLKKEPMCYLIGIERELYLALGTWL